MGKNISKFATKTDRLFFTYNAGGLPALEDASPLAFEDEPVAFEGCIREFKVNNKAYELTSKGKG